MNRREVFFFGQYGQPDRIKVCMEDYRGVWTRANGSAMPPPKTINGVLVCAPGDLIERMGASAVAARIEAVRHRRQSTEDRGRTACACLVPRLRAAADYPDW